MEIIFNGITDNSNKFSVKVDLENSKDLIFKTKYYDIIKINLVDFKNAINLFNKGFNGLVELETNLEKDNFKIKRFYSEDIESLEPLVKLQFSYHKCVVEIKDINRVIKFITGEDKE